MKAAELEERVDTVGMQVGEMVTMELMQEENSAVPEEVSQGGGEGLAAGIQVDV